MVERFERWARGRLAQGFALDQAAHALGTSKRTLARRMANTSTLPYPDRAMRWFVEDRYEHTLSRDLSQFQVFSLLYTTAIVIETFEDVRFLSTIYTHNLFYLIIAAGFAHFVTKSTRVFFLLLLISTADLVYFKFPEVANHTNLMLFANIALILGLCHSRVLFGRLEDDKAWSIVAPVLGLLIIVTFVGAGFHKLNHDFLNPISSCIGWFGQGIARSLTADFMGMGVPAAGIFGLALGICGVLLLKESRPLGLPTIDWRALVIPVAAVVVLGAILAATTDLAELSRSARRRRLPRGHDSSVLAACGRTDAPFQTVPVGGSAFFPGRAR